MPANAESIDSLDSQPLVGSITSQQQQTASANNDQNSIDNILDNFKMNLDNRKDGAKFRRKSELSNQDESSPSATFSTKTSTTIERETEDLNNSNIFELPERGEKVTTTSKSELDPTNSLIDPILSQIFNDSEIGSMFKQALKRASNGTNGGGFNKPIIRKSKNGATIIISSSSTFNNSNGIFNDSSFPFPSLIEKLLPPMFRPLSLGSDSFLKQTTDGNSSNNPEGLASSVATITINSKPVFASSSSSPFGISRLAPMNPFAPFLSAGDPFGPLSHAHNNHHHHHPHHNHHHYPSRLPGLFIKPFRGPIPFGPPSLFGSPFSGPISGPPSLMSMIVRANQLDQADEDSTQSPSSPQTTSKNEKEDSNSKNSDALKVQASQQHNSTIGKPTQSINNNDSEVETLDMPELIPVHSPSGAAAFNGRLHNFYPPRSIISKPSGSMVIFSSGEMGSTPSRFADPFGFPFAPSPVSSPFSPFMSASMSPTPQMMFLGGENGPVGSNGGQMLNPILRSFLSNVMSDIVPVASVSDDRGKDTSNKTGGSNERGDGNNSSSNKVARLSSSSNLNPSWTALSSAELDDDWTNGASEGSIDRWDEQTNPAPSFTSNSNKHIRAHHRSSDESSDSNQPTENSELFPGIQFEHQNPSASPFEGHLESSFIGGNSFRGPSVTVEKFIEAPQARVQTVGAGIRSQSLSRADFEEPSEPTATLSRPSQPTSPFFSPRSISSPSQSNSDDFAPHVGFISRLLNDISRRSEVVTSKQSGSSSIIKNRSMDDDFDEGDSSSMSENMLAQPNNNKHSASGNSWPKIRVASARIRMRPFTERKVSSLVSPSSDTIFMSPTHFTIAENSDTDKEGQASSIEPNKPSFDDTMNSMEDRLNHVLSLASHQTFLPNHKQGSEETHQLDRQNKAQPALAPPAPQSSPSSIQPPQSLAQNNARAAVAHSIPLPPLVPSRSESKHNQVEQKQQKPNSDNPFTSPTSPLFGFPTSSLAQNDLPNVSKPSQEMNNINTNSNNNNSQQNYSNRQQRSFTYHSNNEVASSLSGHNVTPKADQITPAESIGRSRFIPLSGPPASVVMGRRLDDGPFSDEQSVIEQLPSLGNQQRHQQEFAVPSRGLEEQNHPTSGVAENRRSLSVFNQVLVNNIATQN